MSGLESVNQIDISSLKVACKDCNLYQLCLPLGLENDDLERLDSIIKRRRPVKRHAYLYQAGDAMRSIYAVRSGSFKSFTLTDDGTEQITGFSLPGELIGLDGELAKMLAAEFDRFDFFSGPITDNQGNVVVPEGEKFEQSDIDQFPPGAPGLECEYCMYWWADGITAELPEQ